MILFGLLMLTPEVAHADPPTREAPISAAVDVEITLVMATNSGEVDSDLGALAKPLSRLPYSGFSKLRTSSERLEQGDTMRVTLRDGQVLVLRLVSHDADKARVRVRRMKGSEVLADQTINIHRGRPLVTGGQRVSGGQLLHPITVRW